jgi:hypothetical protein
MAATIQRVTQVGVEVLSEGESSPAITRVTQVGVEVLSEGESSPAITRVTQVGVEILRRQVTSYIDLTETIGVSDSFIIQSNNINQFETIGVSDSITLQVNTIYQSETIGVSDAIAAMQEAFINSSETLAVSDSFDLQRWYFISFSEIAAANFNLQMEDVSIFLQNKEKAIQLFFFILTGSQDGLSDIEIPIASFSCRKKESAPTYLSLIIKGFDYVDEIVARTSGRLTIDIAYKLNDSMLREQLIQTHFNNIQTDEGPTSKSITLSGYRTIRFFPKIVSVEHPISISVSSDGKRRFQFGKVDIYLNPTDIMRVRGEEITVGTISYNISASNCSMTVTEA